MKIEQNRMIVISEQPIGLLELNLLKTQYYIWKHPLIRWAWHNMNSFLSLNYIFFSKLFRADTIQFFKIIEKRNTRIKPTF